MEPPSATRPSFPRRRSKVPGGFDTDDDLSPIKTEFDHHETDNVARRPQLGDLPELKPATRDTSSHPEPPSNEGRSALGEDQSLIDEKEMRRKLMDVESSFLPQLSPAAGPPNSGADDTFVHGATLATGDMHHGDNEAGSILQDFDDRDSQAKQVSPDGLKTPATDRGTNMAEEDDDTSEADGNAHPNTSSLETLSSSPTTAAAARTISRAVSMASVGGYETADEHGIEKLTSKDANDADAATPRTIRSGLELMSPGLQVSTHDGEDADNGDVDESEANPVPRKKRPKMLQSRFGSQRSTYSSRTSYTTISTEGASDVTLSAEFALQTGGAAPFNSSTSSRPSQELSRSISLGSMASGIYNSSDKEDGPSGIDNLVPLQEEGDTPVRRNATKAESRDSSVVRTPRANSRLDTPTDTVIAQHVKNVEVPPSLAREFQERFRPSSPEKRNGHRTPSQARVGNNLTLKEQSSTIDKLQKENFNLKLKITFLESALARQSDEGVKAMISENVELRTARYELRKEIREMKKSVRDLEQKLKEKEEAESKDDRADDSERIQGMQHQMISLREKVEIGETEIEKLRQEGFARENEKRRLAEALRSSGQRMSGESDIGVREEMDLWKDLLEAETARREQADEDNRKLREELWRMKGDATSTASNGHLVNGTFSGKGRLQSTEVTRFGGSDVGVSRNSVTPSTTTALVERLAHENAELRREVGAQTSMLTSRNREKEHLWQQIEDLKLGQRGVRSVTGDSILERSASRAHGRPPSRASETTRITQISDAEREKYESKNGELRDEISSLKLENQDLSRKIEELLDELEHADALRMELEDMEKDAAQGMEDLQQMQVERDEALQMRQEMDSSFQELKAEAQERINRLEEELDQMLEKVQRYENEISNREEESEALRGEVRKMSEGLMHVEQDIENKSRKIQDLGLENEDINREVESLEKSLHEANRKGERLAIELESRQGEVAFLREEQDGDKIKIGDLENAVQMVQSNLDSEKERVRDLEDRLAKERHEREVVGSKEKQAVSKMMNDLNRESSSAKDDARKIAKDLHSRELELSNWKQSMQELENGLREALGNSHGTKLSLLASISKLQHNLDTTTLDLSKTRHILSERDQLLKNRDSLLESHGLESRKLAELLEKERQGRRSDKAQHEAWQRTHQHTSRTVTQKDTRITELEVARSNDRKRLATLESQTKEALLERNNLLLTLWSRLSSMCGSDWQHNHSLVEQKHLPTLEVVSSMLPSFTKNLLHAVKSIESLLSGFKSRIHDIETELWKDFQSLEHNLDVRIKRLDRLESTMQQNRISGAAAAAPEIAKLRGENRMLKAELASFQKGDMHARASRSDPANDQRAFSSGSTVGSPQAAEYNATRRSSLMRHHSSPTAGDFLPERSSSISKTSPLQSPKIRNQNSDRDHVFSRHSSMATLNRDPIAPIIQTAPLPDRDHQRDRDPSDRRQGSEIQRERDGKGPLATTTTTSTTASEKEPNQQRWIHRLRELERRLKAEREARLLDRSGARKRLEEGRAENEELRMELERERIRREGRQGGELA